VSSKNRQPEYVEAKLRQQGAGDLAYVISPYDQFDQKWLPLTEVLEGVLPRNWESIVCCLPGKLAFYLSEDTAYILYDPSHQPAA